MAGNSPTKRNVARNMPGFKEVIPLQMRVPWSGPTMTSARSFWPRPSLTIPLLVRLCYANLDLAAIFPARGEMTEPSYDAKTGGTPGGRPSTHQCPDDRRVSGW